MNLQRFWNALIILILPLLLKKKPHLLSTKIFLQFSRKQYDICSKQMILFIAIKFQFQRLLQKGKKTLNIFQNFS